MASINKLNIINEKMHNLMLRDIQLDRDNSKISGYPHIDKPWLKYYDFETVIGDVTEKRLYDVLFERNAYNGNYTAIIYNGKKISYMDLFKKIDRTTRAFKAIGVRTNDVVTICMSSVPEAVYCFYALNKIGATANLINPNLKPEIIKELINCQDSQAVIFTDNCKEKIDLIRNDLTTNKLISLSADDSLSPLWNFTYKTACLPDQVDYMRWSDFLSLSSNYIGCHDCNYEPNKVAAIVYSQDLNDPKPTLLTNKEMCTIDYHQKSSFCSVEPKSKYLTIMPLFTAIGLSWGMHNALCSRATLQMISNYDSSTIELLLDNKPNHIIGTLEFFEELSYTSIPYNRDLTFLKNVISVGPNTSSEIEEKINLLLEANGCKNKLMKSYSLNEAGNCITMTNNEINKVNSLGIPLVKNNIKIVDPFTNTALRYNQLGEIYLKTNTTYLNRNSKNIKIDEYNEKWLRTHNLGYVDEDGFIFTSKNLPLKEEKIMTLKK